MNMSMSRNIKKCVECGKKFDAGLSHLGNESRRKFCETKCKTDWHNKKHYKEHATEIKQAVTDRRRRKRGGKREGAGRKSRPIPREAISIRIEPKSATLFRAICAKNQMSQNQQVTDWIHREEGSSPLP